MYLEMNDLSVSATIGDPKVVLPCIGHDLQPIRHAVMWHKVSVLTGEDVSVSNNGKWMFRLSNDVRIRHSHRILVGIKRCAHTSHTTQPHNLGWHQTMCTYVTYVTATKSWLTSKLYRLYLLCACTVHCMSGDTPYHYVWSFMKSYSCVGFGHCVFWEWSIWNQHDRRLPELGTHHQKYVIASKCNTPLQVRLGDAWAYVVSVVRYPITTMLYSHVSAITPAFQTWRWVTTASSNAPYTEPTTLEQSNIRSL